MCRKSTGGSLLGDTGDVIHIVGPWGYLGTVIIAIYTVVLAHKHRQLGPPNIPGFQEQWIISSCLDPTQG